MKSQVSLAVSLLSFFSASNAASPVGDLKKVLAAGTTATFKPRHPYTASVCAVTPVANVKAAFHCNSVGQLKKPNIVLVPIQMDNMGLCADLCQSDQACVSFGFDSSTNMCTLYGLPLTYMGLKLDGLSTVTFSNRHCYACGPSSTAISVTFDSSTSTSTGTSTSSSVSSTSSVSPPDVTSTLFGGVTAITTTTVIDAGGSSIAEVLIPAITSIEYVVASSATTRTILDSSGASATILIQYPAALTTVIGGSGPASIVTIADPSATTGTIEYVYPAVSTTIFAAVESAVTSTIFDTLASTAIVEVIYPSATGFQQAPTIISGSVAETLTLAVPSGSVSGTLQVVIPSVTGFQTAPTIISGSIAQTLTLAPPSGTVSGTIEVVLPSETGFQTAPTIISGSVGQTLTLALPSGTVSGTLEVVLPSATGFATIGTITAGAVSSTSTIALPSGTASGTVIVIVPTPTNILGISASFADGSLGAFVEVTGAQVTSSFSQLDNGQYAYCCTGKALLPGLIPVLAAELCTLTIPVDLLLLQGYRESFDYKFTNGNEFPLGISNIASPLAGIVVPELLTETGSYHSVNQTFTLPNLLSTLTFALTVPLAGNSACISNIGLYSTGPLGAVA